MLKISFFIFLLSGAILQRAATLSPTMRINSKDTCTYYFHQELKKKVYLSANGKPDFPGGAFGYMRFLNKNLRVPQVSAEELEYFPRLNMEFIVDSDGTIKLPGVNGKTDSSQMDSYEKGVLRLIKSMPKWEPGNCNGKPIAMGVKKPVAICLLPENEN